MSLKDEIKKEESEKKIAELLSKSLTEVKDQLRASSFDTKELVQSLDDSFEEYKKIYEDSLIIKIPAVEPVGMDVITTASLMNIMEQGAYLINKEFDSELISSFKNTISPKQVVVAVGPHVQQVKIGDTVEIRFEDFFRIANPGGVNRKEVNEVPVMKIDERNYMVIGERNIRWIYQTPDYYKIRQEENKIEPKKN